MLTKSQLYIITPIISRHLCSAGESQMPKGESGSVCCHTEISGQEEEVTGARGKPLLLFQELTLLMTTFSDLKCFYFSCITGLVNPLHRLGRCSRSQRAPPQTGDQEGIGNLTPCCNFVPLVTWIVSSLPRVLKPNQAQNSPSQLNRQGWSDSHVSSYIIFRLYTINLILSLSVNVLQLMLYNFFIWWVMPCSGVQPLTLQMTEFSIPNRAEWVAKII